MKSDQEPLPETHQSDLSFLYDFSCDCSDPRAVAEIRIAVGGNVRTPLATILILVKDDNPDVRFSLGENHNIPVEALEALSKDENPYVRFRAEQTLDRLGIPHNG